MTANSALRQRTANGVFTASLTPLDDTFEVHAELFLQHVRWLLGNGCDGVIVMGSSGEANSLSVDQRRKALDVLVDAGVPPERLLVGTGCCALAETITLTRHAVSRGVGGILLLPPFYYKNPSDDGLFASSDHIIQRVGTADLQIYLYHIPPTSQVPFSHALVQRLLECYPDIVVGMKDSSGDFEHMQSMRTMFPQLQLFAGTERYLLDILRLGGAGCISAGANISCALAGKVYEAWRTRQSDVEQLQARLTAIRQALDPFPIVAALKALTAMRTGSVDWQRLCPPLTALNAVQTEELSTQVHALHTW